MLPNRRVIQACFPGQGKRPETLDRKWFSFFNLHGMVSAFLFHEACRRQASLPAAKGGKMKNKTYIAMLGLLALPLCGLAQSYLLQGPSPDKERITLRYFWPQKGSHSRKAWDFFSGLYDLSASFRVKDRIRVIAGVPYMRTKVTYFDFESGSYSKFTHGLGNVSLALDLILEKKAQRRSGFTIGAFLPTLSHKNSDDWEEWDRYVYLAQTGMAADYLEIPKVLDATTPFARFSHYRDLNDGWQFGIEGGGFLIVHRQGDHAPLILHYGAAVAKHIGPIGLNAELGGWGQVAGFVDEAYIHFYHQAALGVAWDKGRLRPGFFYTMFLDRIYRDSSNGTFGFRLQFAMK
jgi:hypothetical protein